MTNKSIKTLKITNFKSIDSLELNDLNSFSVFAGPNGSGKSNFFDALDFVSLFVRSGIELALRSYGGFGNVHSEKRRADYSRKFSFEIECELPHGREQTNEKNFHEDLPEVMEGTPWDRLKQIGIGMGRGPGNNKPSFAKKFIRKNGFDVRRAGNHPNCPSARYFVEKLCALGNT